MHVQSSFSLNFKFKFKHTHNSTLTVTLIGFNWFSLYLRSHMLKYFHMSLNISVSMLDGALSLTCAAPIPRATPNQSMDLYMQSWREKGWRSKTPKKRPHILTTHIYAMEVQCSLLPPGQDWTLLARKFKWMNPKVSFVAEHTSHWLTEACEATHCGEQCGDRI